MKTSRDQQSQIASVMNTETAEEETHQIVGPQVGPQFGPQVEPTLKSNEADVVIVPPTPDHTQTSPVNQMPYESSMPLMDSKLFTDEVGVATTGSVNSNGPGSRSLSPSEWMGQSLVVALVLGGVALVAYGWKCRMLARSGMNSRTAQLARHDSARHDQAGRDLAGRDLAGRDLAGRDLAQAQRSRVPQARTAQGTPFDRSELNSTAPQPTARTLPSDLREELDQLHQHIANHREEINSLAQLFDNLHTQHEQLRSQLSTHTRESALQAQPGNGPAHGFASRDSARSFHVEPKSFSQSGQQRASTEDVTNSQEAMQRRVLALADRGMSVIAISRDVGMPTGQIELIMNLRRASTSQA